MDRRSFLKSSSLIGASGLAALGNSSCAPLLPRMQRTGPGYSAPDMDEYLTQFDRGVETIDSWNLASDLGVDASDPAYERTNRIGRTALSALYTTAMFSDLSVEDQLHPDMQKRMLAKLPEIDEASCEIASYLDSRTNEQREKARCVLQEDDGALTALFDEIDRHAASNGITAERREQTRNTYDEIVWRLKNQPPELVIDEYQNKITRLTSSAEMPNGSYRRDASQLGEAAFWKWQESSQDPEVARGVQALMQNTAGASGEEDSEDSKKKSSDCDRSSYRGAKQMGIGLLIFGASAALTAMGAWLFVFTATVGAIWFLVGLVMAIADSVTAKCP